MTWRDIHGFEGYYQVSDTGLVRSLDRRDRLGRFWRGQLIRACVRNSTGHLVVGLRKDGMRVHRYVHQLVMEAFVGPCPEGMEVCHKDHDPKNNRLKNLMYGTRPENLNQSAQVGCRCRPVTRSDGRTFMSARQAEDTTGVASSSVTRACQNKQRTAGGFGWSYV